MKHLIDFLGRWCDGACASLMLFEVKFFPLFFRIDYNFTPLEVCSLT